MSVIDVARLVEPIAPEQPCGVDIEYDAEFLAMVQAATPKPERQMGAEVVPAEEPNWREVKQLALRVLARSKDLRVLMPLCRALLHTDSFAGFAAGLQTLRGMLEKFWADLFPRLDADDNNDATMRVNALQALVDPGGILRSLREIPMVSARVAGNFGMREIDAAAGRGTMSGAVPGADLIRAAFQEVDGGQLEATFTAVRAAREEVRAIAASLASLLGGSAPDLRPLANVLDGQTAELEGHLRTRGSTMITSTASADGSAGASGANGNSAPAAAAAATSIQSAQDVVVWIDRMCEFYAKNEPSSPVPMLLQRAKRLVSKSFLDVLKDLVPDGLNQAMIFHGQKEESS
ncbi:MAG TPA: type VI secretion system protein TssA [Planctomycetota bacterium]